jgi:hypothetical protein
VLSEPMKGLQIVAVLPARTCLFGGRRTRNLSPGEDPGAPRGVRVPFYFTSTQPYMLSTAKCGVTLQMMR